MPANHLILCHPLLLLLSIFPRIRIFSSESVLCIRWPKYWSFSFSISPSNEYSGLISLRIANKGRSSQSYGFSSSHVLIWVPAIWCFWTVVLEKTLENPLDSKEIQSIHPKGNQSWKTCWSRNSNILAIWCEELTHLKSPWWWERLKAEGEGDNRGWNGWMASVTQSTRVWVNSGSWWWTGRPGMLQPMGSQRVGHDWVTELNWIDKDFLVTEKIMDTSFQNNSNP